MLEHCYIESFLQSLQIAIKRIWDFYDQIIIVCVRLLISNHFNNKIKSEHCLSSNIISL